MNAIKMFFMLSLCLSGQNSIAMEVDGEGKDNKGPATTTTTSHIESIKPIVPQPTDARKRDIYFKTAVLIKMGLNNKHVKSLIDSVKEAHAHTWEHPLNEYSYIPYKDGNGGLLNPILRNYEKTKETIEGEGYTGVRIAINGCVYANGIAEYKFDNTHIGGHYQKYFRFDGEPYNGQIVKKDHYKMSKLEEAILGFLKERAVDWITADLNKAVFVHMGKLNFANRFAQCIKHEWTSMQNVEDSGIRTEMEEELIERYMARSTYWPSRWQTPEKMRSGESFRRQWLDPANDPQASIELTEFEVKLKIPGASGNNDCTVM